MNKGVGILFYPPSYWFIENPPYKKMENSDDFPLGTSIFQNKK